MLLNSYTLNKNNYFEPIRMDYQKVPAKIVTWEEVEKWVEIIAKKIGDLKFDCIVSVIRGGLAPSRIVADYLGIKDIYTLKTEHWGITAAPDGKARVTYPIVIELQGRSVLIFDDITDTGQSLRLAIDATRLKNPSVIKSATLLHITRSQTVPDYYGTSVDAQNWKWFIFPWNKREDYRNLVLNCVNGGTKDDIVSCLRNKYDISIPENELDDAFTWLQKSKSIKIEGSKITKPSILR